MDTTTNKQLLILVVCLLIQWTRGRAVPEKLSVGQKAPPLASSSAGRSLALPRSEESPTARIEQILAQLHLKASGQTPADTSLLARRAGKKRPALLHIKAFGQTPADTSLLPRQHSARSNDSSSQSRRSGQGPAHVTLLTSKGTSSGLSQAGQTPANVGLLGGRPAAAGTPQAAPQEDGVQRQEMTSFKEVNGESVRVVVGNYGYQSPEGLPVSFKYMSDENGNQASFSIGTAAAGGGGGSGSTPGGLGASKAGAGAQGGGKSAAGAKGATGGAAGDGDRKYLPPK